MGLSVIFRLLPASGLRRDLQFLPPPGRRDEYGPAFPSSCRRIPPKMSQTSSATWLGGRRDPSSAHESRRAVVTASAPAGVSCARRSREWAETVPPDRWPATVPAGAPSWPRRPLRRRHLVSWISCLFPMLSIVPFEVGPF